LEQFNERSFGALRISHQIGIREAVEYCGFEALKVRANARAAPGLLGAAGLSGRNVRG
jgi:hypothetical protein